VGQGVGAEVGETMGQADNVTKQGPSQRLEAIVALLIPPARREEVLGDLHERYASPARYVFDAARTVPMVVASQIRRTTCVDVVLLEAFAVCCGLFVGTLQTGGAAALYQQPSAARILIPALVALVALRFVDAYGSERKQSALRAVLGAAIAFAVAFWAEAMLWIAGSHEALWGWPLVRGWLLGIVLVSLIRMSFPQLAILPRVPGEAARRAVTLGTIRRENADFEANIRQRNFREYAAAGFVIVFFCVNLWRTRLMSVRVGSALIVAGMLYIVYNLYRRGAARAAPPDASFMECVDFYRRELERQRDLLRSIWRWYLGPMIPGVLVLVTAAELAHPEQLWVLVFALAMSAMFIVIARLNRKGAQKLQLKIDVLNRIGSQSL